VFVMVPAGFARPVGRRRDGHDPGGCDGVAAVQVGYLLGALVAAHMT
jgi:hypothetical protein